MKLPHRNVWISLLIAGVVLCLLMVYCHRAAHTIRYQNFDRIQDGMTLAEVESSLGCAPGDYRSRDVEFDLSETVDFAVALDMQFGRQPLEWYGDGGNIFVSFDDEGRVRWKYFLPGQLAPHPWWLFIRKKLGLNL